METKEPIKLKRDLVVTQIPAGNRLVLPSGSLVKITQSLGGTYTVITEGGLMVRIAGEDADALSIEPAPASPKTAEPAPAKSEKTVEQQIWDQLRTCFDPEIPINIVDLGLIYLCKVTSLPDGGNKVEIKMTLTAPGCGMGDVLRAEAQEKVFRIPGVKQADVQLVWEPRWDQSRLSEAAKLQLGIF